MTTFIQTVLNQTFLQNALLGGLLASLACGVVGSFVVVKRIGYIAGGIAHAVLGGMGIAYYFGYNPLIGAIAAALFSAMIIGWISLHGQQHEDTIISALWAIGRITSYNVCYTKLLRQNQALFIGTLPKFVR